MQDPRPKNKYEFWFEVGLFGVLSLLSFLLIVVGAYWCTAVHPCVPLAQIMMVAGGALLNVFGDALLVFAIVPVLLERYRNR